MILDLLKNYDLNTYYHSKRVAVLSLNIGKALKCSEEELNILYYAGLYHDIGKLDIPLSIINKPNKLNCEEWEIIKTHPIHSLNLIKDEVSNPIIREIILYHHENINGTGYYKIPNISLLNQIVCVADIYDALTSDRAYRKAFTKDAAIKIIEDMNNYSDIVINTLKVNS